MINKKVKGMLGAIRDDVAVIKDNSIKGLLPEYTDIIKSDDGIKYYSSLFIVPDDYFK